jgi:hypothetical protein
MAASRYLDNVARRSGDPDLFKQAAALGQTARQHELAGWELAAREAEHRPKADPLAAARARISATAAASRTAASEPKTATNVSNTPTEDR